MKVRNREINIFSMSALDLFASALGAFILVSIVLLPYFLRAADDEVYRLRTELAQTQADLQQTTGALSECRLNEAMCRQEVTQGQDALDACRQSEAMCRQEADLGAAQFQACEQALASCEERLAWTFLVVAIHWDTDSHDVDLHIVDAGGEEFYYNRRTVAGRPGRLSIDMLSGPGVEIWELLSQAPEGEYRIYYNLYSQGGNTSPAVVEGSVYFRDGAHRLRTRNLTTVDQKVPVATMTVGSDGSVEFLQL